MGGERKGVRGRRKFNGGVVRSGELKKYINNRKTTTNKNKKKTQSFKA